MTMFCGSLNFGAGIAEDIPKNCSRITKLHEDSMMFVCATLLACFSIFESRSATDFRDTYNGG
jgi:hypothetical protein